MKMHSLVPSLGWIRTYNTRLIRADLLAGVTVAAIAVPEDMAYAAMAGLPPQIGLYASMISLLIYALLGTSSKLSYGPTSALSIMVAGSLGAMGFVDTEQYIQAASFVAISAGAMALVAWILKLGIISNFVSETVLVGFSAGAALFIGSSQLPKLFRIEGVSGNFFERIRNVIIHLGDTHLLTLAVGAGCLLLLVFLEARYKKLPVPLIVVILAILVAWLGGLEERGLEVAGQIEQGLPGFSIPFAPEGHVMSLLGLAFGVFLLSYVEGIGIARTLADRDERIDADQELFANGIANVGSGLFRGYAVGGSMSRSAVNASAGARTPAAGAISAALIVVVLLFLTAPFQVLPEATLAAVVLVAVRHLFKEAAIRRIWETDRREFIAVAATFLGVLVFGMLEGILIGVGVTFLLLLTRVSRPHISTVGKLDGAEDFVDVIRNPQATAYPGVLVMRAYAGLFYANAPIIRDAIMREVNTLIATPNLVVLDMSTAPLIDLGAISMLSEIRHELGSIGIEFRLANTYAETARAINTSAPQLNVIPNTSIREVVAPHSIEPL